MEPYNKEDFDTDCDWLTGQGVETEEAEEFITGLISKGFRLDPKEYVKFMETTK